MTLLIVSYGVNSTVQMSSEPPQLYGYIAMPSSNARVTDNNGRGYNDVQSNGNNNSFIAIMNVNAKFPHRHGWPRPEGSTGDYSLNAKSKHSAEHFTSVRKSRIFGLFGLLGTNYSLSYNLTLSTGTTSGNISVVAAPAAAPYYYYVPAAASPYPYAYGYNPYAYNPYAYNPYAYNPYAPYYYG